MGYSAISKKKIALKEVYVRSVHVRSVTRELSSG